MEMNSTDNQSEMEPRTGTAVSDDIPPEGMQDGSRRSLSRLMAVLVLIPAVPGLLGSVGAMVLFYLSPARFNKLLAMLPGETILRSLLFFAPSALFAVVLLAVLYARQGAIPQAAEQAESSNPMLLQFLARGGLVLGVPALLATTAGLLLSFVAPGRFEMIIEPLPGTSYIERLLPFAPLGLLFIVIPSLLVVTNLVNLGREKQPGRENGDAAARLSRWLVLIILIPSVLLLAMAVAALGLSVISPPHFAKLILRLTSEGVIRLGLLFGSSALLAVVLISSLFLLTRPKWVPLRAGSGRTAAGDSTAPMPTGVPGRQKETPGCLVWLLSAGLFFTVTSSIALFGVAFYLLVR